MADYKLTPFGVVRTTDNACIPNDSGNRDWKKFEEWKTQGNIPDPEDQKPEPTPEEKRKAEYPETVDMSLALIERDFYNDPTRFNEITKKIDDVNKKYPKEIDPKEEPKGEIK